LSSSPHLLPSYTTRPQTLFEEIAELWNSSAFNPVAPASECHLDFLSATDCSYALVAGLTQATTPQCIEDTFTFMRSELLRIITCWEQSGQGERGRDGCKEDVSGDNNGAKTEDDNSSCVTSSVATDYDASPRSANHGSLHKRPARALQTQADFLNGRPSYLLYFWEVADAHQLLQSSLHRISNSTGAMDASGAPSATRSVSSSGGGSYGHQQRRRCQQSDSQEDQQQVFLNPLVESIKELAALQQQLLDHVEDRSHEVQLEEQRKNPAQATDCCKRAFAQQAKLADLARQYRRLNAKRDGNSQQFQASMRAKVGLCKRRLKNWTRESTTSIKHIQYDRHYN
jgi:hypothetical protein